MSMSIRNDVRQVILKLAGPKAASIVDTDAFDNPQKYPEDFLNEAAYFLSRLVGERAAERKLEPLYKKYGISKTKNNLYKPNKT